MSYSEPVNEVMLLHQLAGGDREAFRRLYDNYRDKLYYYILRLTTSKQLAEDILQEVFIRVWMDRDKMADIRSFDAWIFTLAKYKIINGFRRLSMEHAILAEISNDLHEDADSTTQLVDYNEANKALQRR